MFLILRRENEKICADVYPATYETMQEAEKEASRLSKMDQNVGKEFIVFEPKKGFVTFLGPVQLNSY